MKSYRYLLMIATLLASVHLAAAQAPDATGQDASPNNPEVLPQPTRIFSLGQMADCVPDVCPATWLGNLYQASMAHWQRMCAAEDGCCDSACRDSRGSSAPAACNKTRCTAGAPACCAKGCCETVQAKKCGCAKGCGCCESCQPKRAATATRGSGCPLANLRFDVVWDAIMSPPPPPAPPHGAWIVPVPAPDMWVGPSPRVVRVPPPVAAPVPTPSHWMPHPGPAIGMPMPAMGPMASMPYHMVHQPAPSRPVTQAQHAHLVTPDLEAHCERMTHKGDMILLEGEVRLTSRKNGQPIRIEAHRVMLNMRDGTFVVESDCRPAPAPSRPTMLRTSVVEPATFRVIQVVPFMPHDAPPTVHPDHFPGNNGFGVDRR